MIMNGTESNTIQHVFIVGSKSIGQYGGYETFVDKLTEQHKGINSIKYHIACKANGDGYMDESKLDNYEIINSNSNSEITEFNYHNAHIFKIHCPSIGPAVAIYYDSAALKYVINYCKKHNIVHPIIYVLTCRIGLFIDYYKKQIHQLGGKYLLNPDGHEWMRAKWSKPIRAYWKWSEKKMVRAGDLIVCDSINIEKYIKTVYGVSQTRYIAYGSDTEPSKLADDDTKLVGWMNEKKIREGMYYLIVGRFVPENNYETMIREFMSSKTKRDLVIITNINEKFREKLENKLKFSSDSRIKFVGTVYDKELLKKIREKAYGYFHGHEVGGTNPSLLEALGSTKINILLDVGFNQEVAQDAALYWNKKEGSLAEKILMADSMSEKEIDNLAALAKNRIKTAYSWEYIGDEYMKLWNYCLESFKEE